MCPDIVVCTPLAEAVCAKLLTRSRPEARAAREAKVLISLKVSNFDQTVTKERTDFTCKAAGAASPIPPTPQPPG